MWRLKNIGPAIATVLATTPELQHGRVGAQHKTLVGGDLGIAWQVVVRFCCCAFVMTGLAIVANHNLDQVDHVEVAPLALILHMFFVVIAP